RARISIKYQSSWKRLWARDFLLSLAIRARRTLILPSNGARCSVERSPSQHTSAASLSLAGEKTDLFVRSFRRDENQVLHYRKFQPSMSSWIDTKPPTGGAGWQRWSWRRASLGGPFWPLPVSLRSG